MKLSALAILTILLAVPAAAQKSDLSKVTFKPSIETSVPADPCLNPHGAARQLTWFGTDASAVRQEVVTFCTPAVAAAALAERLASATILEERGGEVWASVPDLGPEDIADEKTVWTLYYFNLNGRDLLSLHGADEAHIRRLLSLLR